MPPSFVLMDMMVIAGLVCLQPAEKRWKLAGQLLLISAALNLAWRLL